MVRPAVQVEAVHGHHNEAAVIHSDMLKPIVIASGQSYPERLCSD